MRTITRDEYAEELEEAASPEDDFGQRAWSQALGLFGFVPREQSFEEADIAQRVANVAAFYRRDTKGVTIIRDSDMSEGQGTLTLSHEFVHALQDQRENLAKFYERYADTSDSSLALRCLTEGEAVALSNLTMPEVAAGNPQDLDWDGYFARWFDGILEDVEGSDAPLVASRSLVYPVGGRGVVNAYLSGGIGRIAQFYRTPLITFRGWTEDEPVPMAPESLDCGPPDPPEDYELRYLDRQGMTGLLSLYVAMGQGASFDAARAWVSDWFAVYTAKDEGSEEVAAAFRVRFESEDAASELAELLSDSELAIDAQLQGQELLLTAASSESLLTDWDRSGGCERDKARARRALHYHTPPRLAPWIDEHHAREHRLLLQLRAALVP